MARMKIYLAAVSLVSALLFALLALLLPPLGEIDPSVNLFIAQLLLFAATMLGVDLYVEKFKTLVSNATAKEGKGR